jgi:hypothetical protein
MTDRPPKQMRIKILAPLIILLCAANVLAQNGQCSLKLSELAEAPELIGFRMGMTTEQVKARVPQVAFGRTDEFGFSKTTINPDFDPRFNKSTFAGVRTVSLDFVDGRLTSLWLGYASSFKWHTVQDFVNGISESLHLPNAWTAWRIRGQQLRCVDFQMTVAIVSEGPSFRIVDETAEQTVAARREEASDEAESASGEAPAEVVIGDRQHKIYYFSECPPTHEIKEEDLVEFKSRAEAEKAGYKPAKGCH